MKALRAAWMVAAVVSVTACGARIVVHKIPVAGGDDVKGFRYYLPRPYVAVTTEFPYASEDVYVSGKVVGQYLQLDDATLERLKLDPGHLPSSIPVTSLLHSTGSTRLMADDTGADAGTGAGGSKDGGAGGKTAGSDGGTDGGGKGTDSASSSTEASGTGNGLVVIPNSPFDIVYLPDFEEQYAIEPQAGISVNELKLTLANGWMLESLDSKIDNSAIGSFLMAQAGKTLDVLRSVGAMAAGLPPTGGLQAEGEGLSVLVRVRTIISVTPGLYPVLKPKEMTSCSASVCAGVLQFHTRQARFFEVVRVSGTTPDVAGGPDAGAKTVVEDVVRQLGIQLTVASVDKTPDGKKKVITLDPPPDGTDRKAVVGRLIDALKKKAGFGDIAADWVRWK